MKKEEYERYRCHQMFQNVVKENIPEICKQFYYSIGYFVHDGAYGQLKFKSISNFI